MVTRLPPRRPAARLADLVVVVGAVLPGLLLQASTDPSATAWTALVAADVVIAAALVWRQRRPTLTLWVVITVLIVAYLAAAAGGARPSPLALLPVAICLYGVGNDTVGWRQQVVALAGGAALIGLGLVGNRVANDPSHRGGLDVLAILTAMPLAWASGLLAQSQRIRAMSVQRRADDVLRSQAEREARAAQAERLRIAREMHDVVAHALTLMVLRAETLRVRHEEIPAWARTEVDGIAEAGRAAGNELRDVLRALRTADDDDAGGAGRGSADLEALLDSARGIGTAITSEVDAAFDAFPRHVQLGALRIVQESLTNVRRHAPGSRVTVALAREANELALVVRNTRATDPPTGGGSGFGVLSMRERVQAFGGSFHAGPDPAGGYAVVARIPLDPHAPLHAGGEQP